MKERLIPYDRRAAVAYAHRWAYGFNPSYYNYSDIGGDCTNFASQCLYAGTGVMNYEPVYGWFYRNANDKAPAWTGVKYFHQFVTRTEENAGPFGVLARLAECSPGDFVQLSFDGTNFSHTPIIVAMGRRPTLYNTLVAAHSSPADYRPLSSYPARTLRFLHILGARS